MVFDVADHLIHTTWRFDNFTRGDMIRVNQGPKHNYCMAANINPVVILHTRVYSEYIPPQKIHFFQHRLGIFHKLITSRKLSLVSERNIETLPVPPA